MYRGNIIYWLWHIHLVEPLKMCFTSRDINRNELLFYPYSNLVNIHSGSCNDITNPIAKLCILDVFQNMNIKVFNLMLRTNETCYVSWLSIKNVIW